MKMAFFVLTALFAFSSWMLSAQEAFMMPVAASAPGGTIRVEDRIEDGIELYGLGRLTEAIQQFRMAWREASSPEWAAEALFWAATAEIAIGEYEQALYDLEDIRRTDPANIRVFEVPYHKGRALFYLRRYPEAIRNFQEYEQKIRIDGRYINGSRGANFPLDASGVSIQIEYNKKAAALYWIGECYLNMGDTRQALGYYTIIVEQYKESPKYDISKERIAVINQTQIVNEFQEKIKTLEKNAAGAQPLQETYTGSSPYDEAIIAYQNRIAPYIMLRALGEEQKAAGVSSQTIPKTVPQGSGIPLSTSGQNYDVTNRLLELKKGALALWDRLISSLNMYESLVETQYR
ncbi:MAG: tetratricopeptide repeat protein [Spirochaetaceae bacterium]|jgi:tetratricopeptide (TPR) repeat protein|nr:tetratricopeptide repeat protein [Spirochaetaceae bacterium]